MIKGAWHALVTGLAILTAACASTPEASKARDLEAKNFDSQPGVSTVYVFRPDFPGREDDTVLWVNDRLIGATLPKSYFRIHVNPGLQRFSGYGEDIGTMRLETRPGEIYFVRLQMVAGYSVFETVEIASARRELTDCCGLLENWRPGQRPLLR